MNISGCNWAIQGKTKIQSGGKTAFLSTALGELGDMQHVIRDMTQHDELINYRCNGRGF